MGTSLVSTSHNTSMVPIAVVQGLIPTAITTFNNPPRWITVITPGNYNLWDSHSTFRSITVKKNNISSVEKLD